MMWVCGGAWAGGGGTGAAGLAAEEEEEGGGAVRWVGHGRPPCCVAESEHHGYVLYEGEEVPLYLRVSVGWGVGGAA